MSSDTKQVSVADTNTVIGDSVSSASATKNSLLSRINNIITATVNAVNDRNESTTNTNEPIADNDEGLEEPVQVLEELTISDQLVGIVVALNDLFKLQKITEERLIDFLRQFYEFDTNKMLRPTELQSLVLHNKVKSYISRVSIVDNTALSNISDELVGVVVCLRELLKAGQIPADVCHQVLCSRWKFDTCLDLQHNAIAGVFEHDKVKSYDQQVSTNVHNYRERRKRYDLEEVSKKLYM